MARRSPDSREDEFRQRIPEPKPAKTFRDFATERGFKSADVESMFRVHLFPALGDHMVWEIGPEHILGLMEALKEFGLAASSRKNTFLQLRKYLNIAWEEELIDSNPCYLIPKSKLNLDGTSSSSRELFTPEELRLLISRPWPHNVIYGLMGLAGLRGGEVAALRWSDYWKPFDDLDPAITISRTYDPKAKVERERSESSTRMVPVHHELRHLLDAWRSDGWQETFKVGRRPRETDLVMPADRGVKGEQFKRRLTSTINHRLQDDLRDLGLPDGRTSRELRDSFERLLKETEGIRPDYIQRFMRATNPAHDRGASHFEWKDRTAQINRIRIPSLEEAEGKT